MVYTYCKLCGFLRPDNNAHTSRLHDEAQLGPFLLDSNHPSSKAIKLYHNNDDLVKLMNFYATIGNIPGNINQYQKVTKFDEISLHIPLIRYDEIFKDGKIIVNCYNSGG